MILNYPKHVREYYFVSYQFTEILVGGKYGYVISSRVAGTGCDNRSHNPYSLLGPATMNKAGRIAAIDGRAIKI